MYPPLTILEVPKVATVIVPSITPSFTYCSNSPSCNPSLDTALFDTSIAISAAAVATPAAPKPAA